MGHYDVAVDARLDIYKALRDKDFKDLVRRMHIDSYLGDVYKGIENDPEILTETMLVILHEMVTKGRTYYVTAEMCSVIESASSQLDSFVLRGEDVPTQCGFVYYETLIDLFDGGNADRPLPQRAMCWYITHEDGDAQLNTFWLARREDTRAFLEASLMKADRSLDGFFFDALSDDQKRAVVNDMVPTWYLTDMYAIVLGQEYHNKEDVNPRLWQAHATRSVALWMLMSQRATEEEDTEPTRPVRKRVKRALDGDAKTGIRVVYLRGMRHMTEKRHSEGDAGRLTYRFPVSGHWRNQWYPKLEQHKRIWIAPYVKGPSDGEFRVSEKVTVFKDKS